MSQSEPDLRKIDAAVIKHLVDSLPPTQVHLYHSIDQRLRIELIRRLTDQVQPDVTVRRHDWTHMRDPHSTYRFKNSGTSWSCIVLVCLAQLAVLVGGIYLTVTGWPWGPAWLGWTLCGSLLLIAVVSAGLARDDVEILSVNNQLTTLLWLSRELGLASAAVAVLGNVATVALAVPLLIGRPPASAWIWAAIAVLMISIATSTLTGKEEDAEETFGVLIVGGGSMASTILAVLVGSHFVGLPPTVVLMAGVTAVVFGLARYGVERERRARNPLRGLLEEGESASRRRTSVIAA